MDFSRELSDNEYVTNIKETEGLGYIAQSQFKDLVLDYLVENVKVE